MRLLAIAGCSGSGKTQLAQALVEHFDAPLIALDSYYHPQSALSLEQRAQVNYDHPDALDWALLESHLTALRQGASVEVPHYLFDQHTRAQHTRLVEPAPVVLVEGILALHNPQVRAIADLRVFVHTAETECLRRRLDRDIAERGRTPASVLEQYERTVRPMALEYVLPSQQHADLIVSGEQPVSEAVQTILRRWPPR
jgi:uridine kinase